MNEKDENFNKAFAAWKDANWAAIEAQPLMPKMNIALCAFQGGEEALAAKDRQIEVLEAKLNWIEQWCEAYPLEIFPALDMKKLRELLGDTLLTQLSAYNMRHVVDGVKKIAALEATK